MSEQRVPAARVRRARPPRRGSLLSTVVSAAVTTVLVASAATAWMLHEADVGDSDIAVLEPVVFPRQGVVAQSKQGDAKEVVTAPPLRPALPMSPNGDAAQRSATSVMGAGPACPNCGTVEAVVAVHEYGQARARGYLMHIRMDDGSVRTVQQRGALAAGSRVAVEGGRLQPVGSPQ